jgi:hypothetical protein
MRRKATMRANSRRRVKPAAERRQSVATAEGRGIRLGSGHEPRSGGRFFRRSAALVWLKLQPRPSAVATVCRRSAAGFLFLLALAASLASCSWRPYVATRVLRQFTGAPTRFHMLTPLHESLKAFRAIEVKPLENLIGNHLPAPMERYLNERVMHELQSLKSSPKVEAYDESAPSQEFALVFEGFIDDYDPGYVGLRLLEFGFNHIAITVRFQLRDKKTGDIVGAASITAQDDRATATTKGAVDRLAKRIHKFVNPGYGG